MSPLSLTIASESLLWPFAEMSSLSLRSVAVAEFAEDLVVACTTGNVVVAEIARRGRAIVVEQRDPEILPGLRRVRVELGVSSDLYLPGVDRRIRAVDLRAAERAEARIGEVAERRRAVERDVVPE